MQMSFLQSSTTSESARCSTTLQHQTDGDTPGNHTVFGTTRLWGSWGTAACCCAALLCISATLHDRGRCWLAAAAEAPVVIEGSVLLSIGAKVMQGNAVHSSSRLNTTVNAGHRAHLLQELSADCLPRQCVLP